MAEAANNELETKLADADFHQKMLQIKQHYGKPKTTATDPEIQVAPFVDFDLLVAQASSFKTAARLQSRI
eukprot:118376-Chlamydomonas_euryale.AAC.1